MLSKKLVAMLFISTVAFSSLPTSTQTIASEIEDLPFKQELKVPVDTSRVETWFQPVDVHVEFNHRCWARNETCHSVRVCYDDGSGLVELESQVYDLEFIDENHVKACNLVFLIPENVDGKEKYYVLYSDSETELPYYPDHVKVEDTHYFYEPISGQKMDFDYYKITQDGYVIYGICQKGVLLGEGVSHTIIKLKPNSTEFESQNADQFASFAMSYAVDGPLQYTGTPRAETVSKNILVDGNLMVRVRIESISPENDIKTNVVYTYYYSPTSVKRVVVHVNHQVLKEVKVGGDEQRDGTYASLSTFKSRSATIDNMNVGVILPNLHIYGEDDSIKEYSIPTNPESHNPEWVLSTMDDIDLGSKAWLCIDDSSTGKTHGLIFNSNNGLLEGEEDGIQVKSSVKQVVKLPGLEADTGNLYATRNSYEKNREHNLIIPEGTNVTFDAEFVTFEKGGYQAVGKESEVFQCLTRQRPLFRGNVSVEKEKERFFLTTFVHFAPSFPMGSLFSAAAGKKFPYLYAELYREGSLASSGSVAGLPLSGSMELDFGNTTLFQKVGMVLGLFDWRNVSFFKKIR
ncbi:MAG TPA: carboxypeptidase regulatory-like domain-containing protein, partial [Thermoplasmatales archaeon]|nr:carboxypeptidase regulatory-like domain-containing protein [Thermoplasmatales archaeon]